LSAQFVAEALNIRETKDRSLDISLIEHLRPRTALLILDNCEHLVQAVARLVERILRAAPNLYILATSREALGLAGEMTWRIPNLSTPDLRALPSPETLDEYESVKLFVDRAVSVRPDFAITQANEPAVCECCHQKSPRVLSRFASFSHGSGGSSVPLGGGGGCGGCSSTNCGTCGG
jgi:predicted ATPase